MFDSVFKVVYFVEFVVISIVRTAHTRQYRRLKIMDDRKTPSDMIMLALGGIGILVPLIYVFSTLLDFATTLEEYNDFYKTIRLAQLRFFGNFSPDIRQWLDERNVGHEYAGQLAAGFER